jgi:hypothetical protein
MTQVNPKFAFMLAHRTGMPVKAEPSGMDEHKKSSDKNETLGENLLI